MKKRILLIGLCIVSLISVIVGISYSFWMSDNIQNGINLVQSGCFSVDIISEQGSIDLSNEFSIDDDKGMLKTPYVFTIKNTCDFKASYNVNLEKLQGSTLSTEFVKISLNDATPKMLNAYDGVNTTITGALESRNLASGVLNPDASATFSLRMWIASTANYADAGEKTLNAKIVVTSIMEEPSHDLTAAQEIANLYGAGSTSLAVDEAGNVRYIGSSPDNYANFNGEEWRVIGVFDIDDGTGNVEKRIKLIRTQSLGNFSWGSSVTVNNAWGVNQWGESGEYAGAAIMTELNSYYLYPENYTGSTPKCVNAQGNATTNCNFTGLNENSRLLIDDAVWYTGTTSHDWVNEADRNENVLQWYNFERSNNTGKICSSGTYCNDTVVRTTSWTGKVGLIYPSDYGYATGGGSAGRSTCLQTALYLWNTSSGEACRTDDWLFTGYKYWTITPLPYTNIAYLALEITDDGRIANERPYAPWAIRPVVYLKADTIISDGDGSVENAFEFSMPSSGAQTPSTPEEPTTLASACLNQNAAQCLITNGPVYASDEIASDDPDGNLRYIGSDPNNYVSFNNELWRIIGVFDVKKNASSASEKRIKLYRAAQGALTWDTSETSINGGYGINQWGPSGFYDGAAGMVMLNSIYLNGEAGYCPNGFGNEYNECQLNWLGGSTDLIAGQKYIDYALWNLGTVSTAWDVNNSVTASGFYNAERSSVNGKQCSSGTKCTDTVTRTTTWIGKVGLIYPSDYGYATSGGTTTTRSGCLAISLYNWDDYWDDCVRNSWIDGNQHTLTPAPYSNDNSRVFDIDGSGYVSGGYAMGLINFYPVVYLKSSVKISGGSGEQSDPFTISIDEENNTTTTDSALAIACKGQNAGQCLASNAMTYASGEVANDDPNHNIRYIGSDPSNYVNFNNELWRIIGVFDVKKDASSASEKRIKLIRVAQGALTWDTSETSVNGGYGINQWGPSGSYAGAAGMIALNTLYLNGEAGDCPNGFGNSYYECRFNWLSGSTDLIAGQSYIDYALWNLGTVSTPFDSSTSVTASGFYNAERSSVNGKQCSSGTKCNDTVTRTTTWVGKVGLIYPSDFGYATGGGTNKTRSGCLSLSLYSWKDYWDDCAGNSWIYGNQHTLTPAPYTDDNASVFVVDNSKYIKVGYAMSLINFHPVVYLKANVKITGGEGTASNPYLLGM